MNNGLTIKEIIEKILNVDLLPDIIFEEWGLEIDQVFWDLSSFSDKILSISHRDTKPNVMFCLWELYFSFENHKFVRPFKEGDFSEDFKKRVYKKLEMSDDLIQKLEKPKGYSKLYWFRFIMFYILKTAVNLTYEAFLVGINDKSYEQISQQVKLFIQKSLTIVNEILVDEVPEERHLFDVNFSKVEDDSNPVIELKILDEIKETKTKDTTRSRYPHYGYFEAFGSTKLSHVIDRIRRSKGYSKQKRTYGLFYDGIRLNPNLTVNRFKEKVGYNGEKPIVFSFDFSIFIIMPFSNPELNNKYYEKIIKKFKVKNLQIKRGDDYEESHDIMDVIIEEIKISDIIIADLTHMNPNVFYELGIARQLSKYVIQVCQENETIPFDVSHYRTILYENSEVGFEHLSTQLYRYICSYREKEIKKIELPEREQQDLHIVKFQLYNTGLTFSHEMSESQKFQDLYNLMRENFKITIEFHIYANRHIVPESITLEEFLSSNKIKFNIKKHKFIVKPGNKLYFQKDIMDFKSDRL